MDGVPLTVKDNIAVKGMRATWGSRLFASHVSDDDNDLCRNGQSRSRSTSCEQEAYATNGRKCCARRCLPIANLSSWEERKAVVFWGRSKFGPL
ncbi:amidase family protein [Rhizobium sp. WYJ-E13]|uniref:amidase family protein n=1 Tax=Rhizobium sp. WYJ-E13 TaxID=2849093 RepID=UPI00265881B3|nr:amidase family protein [Rhizobium sp. WYJ-E13]